MADSACVPLLPDETYAFESERRERVRVRRALRQMRAADRFLRNHNIRPDFFCRYRDKLLLQKSLRLAERKDPVSEDASSSNEAVHLQQRLRSLSTELVTLRNRLHVTGAAATASATAAAAPPSPHSPHAPHPPQPPNPAPRPPPHKHHQTHLMNGPPPPPVQPPSGRAPPAPPAPLALPLIPPPIQPSNNVIIPQFKTKENPYRSDTTRSATGLSPNVGEIAAPSGPAAPNGSNLEDLIQLTGPLTEDAVLRCLHARFLNDNVYTNIGPIVVSLNAYTDTSNPLTLSSARLAGGAGGRSYGAANRRPAAAAPLTRVVRDAVRQQADTGYPQAIILSGSSGSGKTHASMSLLRSLFDEAGGGPETDAFKHLAAAFTVLRSLGSAKTRANTHSSRIGQFIEVQVTDGALYRTKIHCYFLDQTRVIKPLPNEKNYHIFYQMLAGLSHEERLNLNLDGYNPQNLKYLMSGDTGQNESEDSVRFQSWKACLGVLGIPFLDVVRVLSAVLLLGNIQFVDGQRSQLEVDVRGENELNAVGKLLGVSRPALLRGLTSRTHNARGQLVKSVCDANMSNMTRDSLAKALYCRTVATIVRRANSLKRLGSTLGTLSSDSNESVHNQADAASQRASTVGGGNAGSKSMAVLNNAVRHATDGFIGILDMFGFEDPKLSQLEHLCINLCAETMQHFYNTHIFKSSIESCREEGIQCDLEVDYVDNVPCIDLISSLRTGLLSMLDVECSIRGTAESYVAKMKVQHKSNARLFEPKPLESRLFGIQHFAGKVIYDASDFLDTNKDVVPDDLVAVFYKDSCNFGFATHLFGSELKALYSCKSVPRGVSFRISPTSHTDLLNGDEPVSTLTQDFHTRLDNLLRTLVHARPHFVRCIRSNDAETPMRFDRGVVVRQIRSLQVLETVNLMAGGYPHRMRFKAFNARYKMLAPFHQLRRIEEKSTEDCLLILRHTSDEGQKQAESAAMTSYALGKRHIFLSEGMRQRLEGLRGRTRSRAATAAQAAWRGFAVRRRLAGLRARRGRPRPAPIAGTPPPEPSLALERPPPLPPSRPYTVTGGRKLPYPQARLMTVNFPDAPDGSPEIVLRKGEGVLVISASPRRGHLIVEHNSATLHVPFQYMELVRPGATILPPTVKGSISSPLNII